MDNQPNELLVPEERIASRIFLIRGEKVTLESDSSKFLSSEVVLIY